MKKIKAAILGFGGMGHCHAAQYPRQKEVELVALCDINPEQMKKTGLEINLGKTGKTNLSGLRKYTCYEDLVKNEKLDYIDICLPTDLHCEYSIRAMNDGMNVLCEKPMALNTEDAEKMIAVSRKTGKKLMIAQCLRFAEEFQVVRKAFEEKTYGKLLRLSMHRVGGFPGGWFREVKRSGGALMDLHIHDIDFIQSMLGLPESLMCHGAVVKSGGIDDSITCCVYPENLTVSAECSWARGGFEGTVAAVFEEATVLIGPKGVTLYQMDQKEKKIRLPGKGSPYFHEIAYFANCVRTGKPVLRASPESTRDTIRLIELEIKSAFAGGRSVRP